MSNTTSSIEVQIDNFLEHFKRSASKAIDTDWITTDQSSNYANTTMTAASLNHSSPLNVTKTRSSCFDISQLGSMSGTKIKKNTYNHRIQCRVCRLFISNRSTIFNRYGKKKKKNIHMEVSLQSRLC